MLSLCKIEYYLCTSDRSGRTSNSGIFGWITKQLAETRDRCKLLNRRVRVYHIAEAQYNLRMFQYDKLAFLCTEFKRRSHCLCM